jgi:hypothetical protein
MRVIEWPFSSQNDFFDCLAANKNPSAFPSLDQRFATARVSLAAGDELFCVTWRITLISVEVILCARVVLVLNESLGFAVGVSRVTIVPSDLSITLFSTPNFDWVP